MTADGAVTGAALDRFRTARDALEAAVLPLATSLDGRALELQLPLPGLAVRVGGYVVLGTGTEERLGQVHALRLERRAVGQVDVAVDGGSAGVHAGLALRYAAGTGVVLTGDRAPLHDADVRPATPDDVARLLADVPPPRGAPLRIGELALAPGVPAVVDARGLGRHTFVCGQSGSGKTYALGLLLERVLTQTGLRIVVLDPNSDHVGLGRPAPGVDGDAGWRYRDAARGVAVHGRPGAGRERLRLRAAELAPAAQAALLRLDPVADREEHAELVALLADDRPPALARLEASGRPEAVRLALRARSLGVDRLAVWAGDEPGSVLDALADPAVRCLVIDLGALGTEEEQRLVSAAVLGALWRGREAREPCLVVIDEAHTVCPAVPGSALGALASEEAVRIAGEGRKYGLHLLACTQRPQKVHPNVVTQCDNLVLMRMASRGDLAAVRDAFSFVPPALVDRATELRQGEAVVAGGLVPEPALARFGGRLSAEGGGDVPATWADGPVATG